MQGTHKLKILVVGGSSFLGRHLSTALEKHSDFEIVQTGRGRAEPGWISLDLLQVENTLPVLVDYKFDIIVWVAAVKDVKWCEKNPEAATKINRDSFFTTYEFFQKTDAPPKFIFISSDYVFDGAKGGYDIDAQRNPTTVYGHLKKDVEDYLFEKNNGDCVVRTSALCGKGSVFLTWLTDELRQEKDIGFFDNSYFTPTSVTYISNSICDLIREVARNQNGRVVHICGDQRYSRFEFAKRVQEQFSPLFKACVKSEKNLAFERQDLSLVSSAQNHKAPHSLHDLFNEVEQCIK